MTPEIRPIVRGVLAKVSSLESMQEIISKVEASSSHNKPKLLEPPQQIVIIKENV